jgi:hypothetical protein
MPGCTKAKHSNIKPVEPEKPKEKDDLKKFEELVVNTSPKPVEPMTRPSECEELILLPSTISPNLQTCLSNRKNEKAAKIGIYVFFDKKPENRSYTCFCFNRFVENI